MPMSWKHGSQLTITSDSTSTSAPTNIASAFDTALQVGARAGLMQHREAGAPHPDGLCGRGDLDRRAGQHCDRIAVPHAGGGQTAGNAAASLVHLAPGMPDGGVRLPGDHALEAVLGVVVHGLGESAQVRSPGSHAGGAEPFQQVNRRSTGTSSTQKRTRSGGLHRRLSALRRGNSIAAAIFPRGWSVNREDGTKPTAASVNYRAKLLRSCVPTEI